MVMSVNLLVNNPSKHSTNKFNSYALSLHIKICAAETFWEDTKINFNLYEISCLVMPYIVGIMQL